MGEDRGRWVKTESNRDSGRLEGKETEKREKRQRETVGVERQSNSRDRQTDRHGAKFPWLFFFRGERHYNLELKILG